jgi:hypothetical protein
VQSKSLEMRPGATISGRYTAANGKRCELGLGAADRSSIEAAGASLKEARKRADEARVQLEAGTDPIDLRRGSRHAERKAQAEKKAEAKGVAITLRRYVRSYCEKHVTPVRTFKHGQQWLNSIEQHVPATLPDASESSTPDATKTMFAPSGRCGRSASVWTARKHRADDSFG